MHRIKNIKYNSMKREFLKDLGLTDEVIEKVMSEHGKDVQDVNSKLASAEQ